METRAFRIMRAGSLEPMPIEQATDRTDAADSWVDLTRPDLDEVGDLLSCLGLAEAAPVLRRASGTLFQFLRDCVVINFPALTDQHDRTRYITFVCGRHLLVSLHDEPSAAVAETIDDLTGALRLESPTKTDLLFALVSALYRDNIHDGFAVRDEARDLLRLLDENENALPLEAIIDLKRRLGRFATTCEDQVYLALRFRRHHPVVFRSTEEIAAFRSIADIYFHQAFHFIERLEARVSALDQQVTLRLTEAANARLRLLTLLSVTFLPLTLLASIYGMNFEHMPELHWRYGYPLVLLLMAIMASASVWYFYRRGWFRLVPGHQAHLEHGSVRSRSATASHAGAQSVNGGGAQ
jgi:magnesium transporter